MIRNNPQAHPRAWMELRLPVDCPTIVEALQLVSHKGVGKPMVGKL